MGRPSTPLGTWGKIRIYPDRDGYAATTLYRDYDGQNRKVQKRAKTEAAARRALATELRDRARAGSKNIITPDSRIADVAEIWHTQLTGLGRSPSTIQMYRDRLDKQVLPALGAVRLRELTVGLVDRHLAVIKDKHGPSMAKLSRSVLSGICSLACRHDALIANPCRETGRITTKPAKEPIGLSIPELQQLRAYLTYDNTAVQRDLPDLVAFMSATGMRIGEVCALQWAAVNLQHATVDVRGTVLRLKGVGLIIRDVPKSRSSERTLELPHWAIQLLTRRAHQHGQHPHQPVFATELGHLRDPANTRRGLREAFTNAGYHGLTSHTFRKTVASIMDDAGLTARAAADQLGHAKPSLTQDIYYKRKVRHTGAAQALAALAQYQGYQ